MKIAEKRKDKKRWQKRRQGTLAAIGDKTEQRRKLCEERRKAMHDRKRKKKRDPVSEEREAKLKEQIDKLHDEIMGLGDDLEVADQRIKELEGRAAKLGQKIEKAGKAIRKAIRRKRHSGPDAALRAAQADDGVSEQPPGSNWGGKVQRMILWLGYNGPVYWCGCAAGWWTLNKGDGKYTSKIRRGYAGFVEADARANTNGLRVVSTPAKAGIASLWGNEHIVVTTGRVKDGMFETAEGNTSDTTGGSQSNGDSCCYGKWRPIADADVFAAQDY